MKQAREKLVSLSIQAQPHLQQAREWSGQQWTQLRQTTTQTAQTWQQRTQNELRTLQRGVTDGLKSVQNGWQRSGDALQTSSTNFAKKVFVFGTSLGQRLTNARQRWAARVSSVAARFARRPTASIVTPKLSARAKSKILFERRAAWRDRLFLAIAGISIALTMCILAASFATYEYIFKDLPSVSLLLTEQPELTTKIYDRNGHLLYRIYKDENRTLVPLSQIPVTMQHAAVAIEDKEFYIHHGISLRGILRAFKGNLQGEQVQGGSTITQQLVKNTLLTSERTLQRKLREAVLAWLVEESFSKDQILELYLNEVAYGGSTYGIEAAAQRYFGKPARSLTLAESAYLAGIPAAPSLYGPFGSNPEIGKLRQQEVLRRMVEDGYITQAQAEEAHAQELKFQQDAEQIRAPHFVMYVRALLAQQYGEEVLNHGGLEVRTTLDLELHEEVQKMVTDEVARLGRLRIGNGAALVTNPQTGEVLSMVGSKNYFDIKNDGQVNVTIRPRQPGSSIKPLAYALALERGQTPATTIVDAPITFSIPGSPPYSPKNYDGKFHGTVTIRESLGSSYNIPAVKTLASIGVNTMIDKAQEMGVSTWNDRQRFGLSLTLGGGEVMMTELSQIYGTFANGGDTIPLNPILEVKSADGQIKYRNECALSNKGCPRRQTLDPKVAAQITDILSDNNARTPAFGPRSLLYIPGQQVAVKTGTTNSLRDNWTVGYTTDRLVAVWVGNNDNTPMSYVASGVTGASPIWNSIMLRLLDSTKPHSFGLPPGLVKVSICSRTGTLPCRGCPNVREEIFKVGTEPTQACNPAQFVIRRPNPSPNPTGEQTQEQRDQILEGVTVEGL